jgi:hypothetical protein
MSMERVISSINNIYLVLLICLLKEVQKIIFKFFETKWAVAREMIGGARFRTLMTILMKLYVATRLITRAPLRFGGGGTRCPRPAAHSTGR